MRWWASEGATGYRVQWKRAGREEYDTARQADVTGTVYGIWDLTAGVEYTVRVAATNDNGVSEWSPKKPIMPAAPLGPVTNLQAAAKAGRLELSVGRGRRRQRQQLHGAVEVRHGGLQLRRPPDLHPHKLLRPRLPGLGHRIHRAGDVEGVLAVEAGPACCGDSHADRDEQPADGQRRPGPAGAQEHRGEALRQRNRLRGLRLAELQLDRALRHGRAQRHRAAQSELAEPDFLGAEYNRQPRLLVDGQRRRKAIRRRTR